MAKFFFYFIALNLLLQLRSAQGNDDGQALAFCCGVPAVVVLIAVAISSWWSHPPPPVSESCTCGWISLNSQNLYYDLNRRIYGQHLVTDIVFKQIKGHWNNNSPKKALVLSFNGMSGIGKNYVSRIIAENIYRKGMASKYVKLIIGSHDFKHRQELEWDKRKLKDWIVETVSSCPRALFIFDEVEKMRPELVDVLKPFLSDYENVDGVDYRKAIFIFIGDTGADIINREVIAHYKQQKRREEITKKHMDKVLNKDALEKEGGFLHSTLLKQKLVDYFIPFLPLERHHVIRCIEDDLKKKNRPLNDHVVQNVLNELLYFPEDSQWFSESGCKKVSSKVDQYIAPSHDESDL